MQFELTLFLWHMPELWCASECVAEHSLIQVCNHQSSVQVLELEQSLKKSFFHHFSDMFPEFREHRYFVFWCETPTRPDYFRFRVPTRLVCSDPDRRNNSSTSCSMPSLPSSIEETRTKIQTNRNSRSEMNSVAPSTKWINCATFKRFSSNLIKRQNQTNNNGWFSNSLKIGSCYKASTYNWVRSQQLRSDTEFNGRLVEK